MEENFGTQNCHHFVRSSARHKFFSQNEDITSVQTADAGSNSESSKGTKLHGKQQQNITNVIKDKHNDFHNKKRIRSDEGVQLNVESKRSSFFMVEGLNREEHCDKEPGWHQGIQRINTDKKKQNICKNEDIVDAVHFFSPEELIEKETTAVRAKGMVALATASSGVAAGLLPGGRTAHSRFKIPLQIKICFRQTVDSNNIDRRTKFLLEGNRIRYYVIDNISA